MASIFSSNVNPALIDLPYILHRRLTKSHSFSIFMLIGLLITIFYIPTLEIGSDGVKTLEEWEIGRGPNGFSKTWVARMIAKGWRWGSRSWDRVIGLVDRDEGERRREMREIKEEKRMRGDDSRTGDEDGDWALGEGGERAGGMGDAGEGYGPR